MRLACFTATLLVLLSVAHGSQPPDPKAAAKAKVEALLAALAAGDHGKALADWPADAPGRAAFRTMLPGMYAPPGYTGKLEGHDYFAWKVGEKELTVRFRYVVLATAKKGNDEYRSTMSFNARFVRSGDGWAWAACSHAATDAAAAIRAAATADEASRVLKDNADVQPRHLARALLKQAIAAADAKELAPAKRVRDALAELARADAAKVGPYAEYAAGLVARAEGKSDLAAAAFGRSVKGFAALASPGDQLDALFRRIDALIAGGNLPEAEQEGLAGIALARKLNAPVDLARALSNHGMTLSIVGRYAEAAHQFRAAIQIERDHKLPGEQTTLNNLGMVERRMGNHAAAVEALTAARKLSEAAGDDVNLGYVLLNLSAVAHDEGRYDDALADARKGGEAFRKARHPYGIMAAKNSLALVQADRGATEEALAVFREGYQVAQGLGDVPAMGTALLNIGLCQRRLGLYSDALLSLHRVAEGAHGTGDRPMEAKVHLVLATLHLELGDQPRARYHAARAGVTAAEIGDRKTQSEALLLVGSVEYTWNHPEEGERLTREAQKLAREANHFTTEVSATVHLAVFGQKAGRHDEAVQSMRELLARVERTKNPAIEQEIRLRLATVLLRAGKVDEAEAEFNKTLDPTIPVQRIETRHMAGLGLGMVAVARKDWKAGVPHFRTAVQVNEELRANIRGPESRVSQFAEATTDAYQGLARCLAELGRDAEAFEVAERSKGRTLGEILQNGQVLLARGVSPQERAEEQELARVVAERANALDAIAKRNAAPEAVAEAQRRLAAAQDRVTNYRRLLYAAHPELQVARAEFTPADLNQLGSTLFRAHPELVVLSYFVADEQTLIFVLRAGEKPGDPARLSVHRIDVKQAELHKQVNRYVELCTRPVAQPVSRDLVRWLLPAEAATARHLLIVPDGPLHRLPFQALRDKAGPYLIERCPVSYAPSVTALAKITELADRRRKDRAGPATLLTVGISDFGERERTLAEAEVEAKAVAEQFQTQLKLDPAKPLADPRGPSAVATLLGREATKANVRAVWADRRYLHFATHGQCNEQAPLYSSVLLTPAGAADDGRLYGRDLLDAEINAELVVLSACQTGWGREMPGEGLLGLGWAWFVAGAPSLVASQWNVADESTARLMKEFYDRLLAGSTKADALRAAQLALLKDRDTRHPFYWAPFVLMGDWK